MLTYKGHRYNGSDQEFIKKLMDDLIEAQALIAQLLDQSKTETRIKR